MTAAQVIRQYDTVVTGRPVCRYSRGFGRFCFGVLVVLMLPALAAGASVGAANGYGGANASVASPVRSATTPLSSYQNGLVSRPNPVDSSGNLVVTGNVGAGKHFRDTVPYRSTTSIYAPLGSTALDSFMRYSAVPEASSTPMSPYSPFYSASGTAAAIQPGTRSVFLGGASPTASGVAQRPVDTTLDTRYLDVAPRVTLPGSADVATDDDDLATAPRLQLWPSAQRNEGPREGHPGRASAPRHEDRIFLQSTDALTGEDYRQQMDMLQQRLGEVKNQVAQLEQSLAVRSEPTSPAAESLNRDWTLADRVPIGEGETADGGSSASVSEAARREQLLRETARLLAGTTGLPRQLSGYEDATPSSNKTDLPSEMGTGSEPRLRLYDPSRILAQAERINSLPTQSGRVGLAPPPRSKPSVSPGGASPTLHTSATPAVPQVTPDTAVVQTSVQTPAKEADTKLAATSLEEFTRHLQLAERYFQKGAYRHAAETYALAIAYQPRDPRAYLGHSQALLAAGQNEASAVSLAKAMELDSQYALTKVDMIALVGGPDAFIARFNALNEAVQKREAPMLQFLLAYICYQMDRPVEARAAIDAARKVLPTSVAIDKLRAAIVR